MQMLRPKKQVPVSVLTDLLSSQLPSEFRDACKGPTIATNGHVNRHTVLPANANFQTPRLIKKTKSKVLVRKSQMFLIFF